MEIFKQTKYIVYIVLVSIVLIYAIAIMTKDSDPTDQEAAPSADVIVNEQQGVVGSETSSRNSSEGVQEKNIPSTSVAVQPPPSRSPAAPSQLTGKRAPEFLLPSGFSNSEEFKLQSLIGRNVILVTFENFTSINSLRATPYLNLWYSKYKNKGLSVITIHTPRFAFDRAKNFVDQTAFTYKILNPIVLDNQFANAKAWGSKEWPSHFLVDINGLIVASYVREGKYQVIEEKIQQLLSERAIKLKLASEVYTPFEWLAGSEVADFAQIKSPETHFGSANNSFLGNGTKYLPGLQDMKPIATIAPHTLYLTGSWEFTGDYAKASIEKNKIIYRYSAKNVYGVFGSQKMNKVIVTLDGGPLGSLAGKDVREEKGQSYFFVSEERMYDIVKGDVYGEHTLEFVSEFPGLEAYVLMFG